MKILMVENHAVFARTVIGQFLGDHDVDLVATIDAARISISSAAYQAVLVDYDLDDGKGDVVVRALIAQRFVEPIVVISSHDDGNDALVRAGATIVCRKTRFHTIAETLAGR